MVVHIDVRLLRRTDGDLHYLDTLFGGGISPYYTTRSPEEIEKRVRGFRDHTDSDGMMLIAEWAGKVVAVGWVNSPIPKVYVRPHSHGRPNVVMCALGIRESHRGDKHLIAEVAKKMLEHFRNARFGPDGGRL